MRAAALLIIRNRQILSAPFEVTDTLILPIYALLGIAFLVAVISVMIFMVFFYKLSGINAVVALTLNVIILFGALAYFRASLTLPGIAGIILGIGMAVDANVLIFERIKEEAAQGKGVLSSIATGFSRAFSAIFDSNLTTLITALVLLQFGTGSVQGFALTMTFGIFATLFTGLFVTHVLTDLWVQRYNRLGIGRLRIFRDPKIPFVRLRVVGYTISGLLLVAGLGTMIARGGPQLGVEFTGGVMADVTFEKLTSEDVIKGALFSHFPTSIVQRVRGSENRFLIRVKTLGDDVRETRRLMRADLDQLRQQVGTVTVGGSDDVSDTVGGEYVRKAILAIVIASVCILIFLWFRFELIFGAGAVVALFHDVLITFGLLAIFNQEISLNVIAALLIVVGYSVNDTIVIFDRIRETIRTTYGKPYPEMLNLSINQSLNRTTVTSLSTLFTMLIMLTLGGPGLRGFAMVLTIGIIIGTYSSSFVATPVLYEYHEFRRRRQAQAPS